MTAPFNNMHDLLLTECFVCDFVEAVSQQTKAMICQYLLFEISGNSMFSFSNFDPLTKKINYPLVVVQGGEVDTAAAGRSSQKGRCVATMHLVLYVGLILLNL